MQQKSLRIATIIATLLASVVLQGCGTMSSSAPSSGSAAASAAHTPPTEPPTPCTPGLCRFTVTVNNCDASGGIEVDPPYASTDVPAVMIWRLSPQTYQFASNGIDFSPNNGQFKPVPGQPSWQFVVQNDKTAQGKFYYYVNVVGCKQVDPWIKNN